MIKTNPESPVVTISLLEEILFSVSFLFFLNALGGFPVSFLG